MPKMTTPELQEISDRLDMRQAAGRSKYDRLREQRQTTKMSWSSCDPRALQDAIASVTADGAALLLSVTSDGGALALRVIDGKKGVAFYPATESALKDLLGDLAETATNA